MTHLLVVDDEVSILELIKNSLGKDGYLITVCQNADDVDIKKLHLIFLLILCPVDFLQEIINFCSSEVKSLSF